MNDYSALMDPDLLAPRPEPGKRRATIWKTCFQGMRGRQHDMRVVRKNQRQRLRVKNQRRAVNGLPPVEDYAEI